MTLLQPWMLWFLPAAALPVLIHLLNRLRFRSVSWAAMDFILKAARHSTRRSRLRHFLILACRTLALLGLLLAVLRPLAGGWIGRMAAAPPGTVVVLLDRSASMEAQDARSGQSKREWLLAQAAQTPLEAYRGARFLLIDSATLEPLPLASLEGVAELEAAQPTDTAADGLALLRAAAEALEREGAGRAEIWTLTDLQRSAWRPEARGWEETAARLAGRPAGVRVRVMALPEPPRVNAALALAEASAIRQGDRLRPRVDLVVRRTSAAPDRLPVVWEQDGVRTPFDLAVPGAEQRFSRLLEPLPADDPPLVWGRFTLPADEHPGDNTVWYAFGPEPPRQARVAADEAAAGAVFARALAPHPLFGRRALPPPGEGGPALGPDDGLVVWQRAPPDGDAARALEAFVEEGGVVLFAPPTAEPAEGEAGADAGPWGLRWGSVETAPPEQRFRVEIWEEQEGPLARGGDGLPLGMAHLRLARRRAPLLDEDAGWRILAADGDGRTFLARRALGAGTVYACATLPTRAWSNLAEGTVLLPMLQRMLERGAARASPVRFADCGAWRPEPGEPAVDLVRGIPTAHPVRAGVYRAGDRVVVLNRPAGEDDPGRLDAADFAALLPGVSVDVWEGTPGRGRDAQPSEIAPLLLAAALLFLLAEGALLLAEHPSARRGAARRAA